MPDNSSISNFKALARNISLVENEAEGFEQILQNLRPNNIPLIGFTGPPGAGKSTLLNAVLGFLLAENKMVGLVLVDPSSPFNLGALLGDRLRMSNYFNNNNIFIRSVASRGSLGGLSDKILEVVELMKSYPFDVILVETVGVGQSEVEIAGLADTTVIVLVPESGDSVQTMKAGLMEIADIFVINKADRQGAEAMENALSMQLELNNRQHIPILKTVAVESKGVKELISTIFELPKQDDNKERKLMLLAEKALRIIAKYRMKNFDLELMKTELQKHMGQPHFNIYGFIKNYF